ncbi:MAG TPA: hypothetical protein VJV78_39145 [Polyangiales bacterium]|nr:hypothetical protein [Polyangiales bacterium]
MSDFREELAATVATAKNSLHAIMAASERTDVLTQARRTAIQLAERERARLRRELSALDTAELSACDGLMLAAETTRLERAAALLAQVFDEADPHSVVMLVAAWRREPTRALTLQLMQLWAALRTRAEVELGQQLGDHVLLACFVDAIAAEVGPGSTMYLSATDAGCGQKLVTALAKFRRALSPGDAGDALQDAENRLLGAARRGVGSPIEAHHGERMRARRTCATVSDYGRVTGEIDERVRAAKQKRFEETYEAPPPQQLGRGTVTWDSPLDTLDDLPPIPPAPPPNWPYGP